MPKQISFEHIKTKGCEHCPHNKDAIKPYKKLKKVDLDDLTLKLYEKAEKLTGLNSNCIMCVSLHSLMAMPEKDLVKLLEAATKLPNR